MDKYIVEIDGKNIYSDSDGKSKLALSVKADNGYAVFCTEIPLTPYTEPDMEQVRKKFYEQGRKDGKIEGQAESWVCVKKIAFNPESVECVDDLVRMGFDVGDGNGWSEAIEELFEKYTATEAIEKIRQYEQRQEEQIQVGDEIEAVSGKAVVVYVDYVDEHRVRYVYSNGVYAFDSIGNVTKTGRHFPEIAEVLAKMKESDNG